MERRLRALDRQDERARAAGLDPYDLWLDGRSAQLKPADAAPQVRRAVWKRLRTVIVVAAAITIPLGAALMITIPGADSRAGSSARTAGLPHVVDESDAPIGTPAAPPVGSGSFAFIRTQRGSDAEPVAWDPCRPIHYATNGIAPPLGQELLAAAFARVTDVTGFRFVNDGPTTEQASMNRNPYQPERYGERWAPVLISWTTPDAIPQLAGATIGVGGGIAATDAKGHATYVSGILYLDEPQISTELSHAEKSMRDAAMKMKKSIMLHEMGHLLGLGHVDDRNELMYPVANADVIDFAVGDLQGLYTLSTGPCAPML